LIDILFTLLSQAVCLHLPITQGGGQFVDKLRLVMDADAKAFFKGPAQGVLFFLGDLSEVLVGKPDVKGLSFALVDKLCLRLSGHFCLLQEINHLRVLHGRYTSFLRGRFAPLLLPGTVVLRSWQRHGAHGFRLRRAGLNVCVCC